jgi:hypothetical protein
MLYNNSELILLINEIKNAQDVEKSIRKGDFCQNLFYKINEDQKSPWLNTSSF